MSILTTDVLSVGNSFTRDANYLRESLNDADPEHLLNVTQAYIGGCSLEKHVTLALQNESDPENPEFKNYPNPQFMPEGRYALKDMLCFKKWNYITIQQVSALSDEISTYRPHAKKLCSFIKKYCPDAEIIFHQTWADRVDNPRMVQSGKTQAVMYKGLSAAVRQIANELGNLRIIPLGDAFQVAGKTEYFKFIPDENFIPEKAVYPELPDQSKALCIGWRWSNSLFGQEYKLVHDHHAALPGRLLGALVWRQFFFPEIDIRQNKFVPDGISDEAAEILREVAFATVRNKINCIDYSDPRQC